MIKIDAQIPQWYLQYQKRGGGATLQAVLDAAAIGDPFSYALVKGGNVSLARLISRAVNTAIADSGDIPTQSELKFAIDREMTKPKRGLTDSAVRRRRRVAWIKARGITMMGGDDSKISIREMRRLLDRADKKVKYSVAVIPNQIGQGGFDRLGNRVVYSAMAIEKWRIDSKASAAAVLAAMWRCAEYDTGSVIISKSAIMGMTGLSWATVKRTLIRLERHGLIRGYRRTSRYRQRWCVANRWQLHRAVQNAGHKGWAQSKVSMARRAAAQRTQALMERAASIPIFAAMGVGLSLLRIENEPPISNSNSYNANSRFIMSRNDKQISITRENLINIGELADAISDCVAPFMRRTRNAGWLAEWLCRRKGHIVRVGDVNLAVLEDVARRAYEPIKSMRYFQTALMCDNVMSRFIIKEKRVAI